MREYVLRRLIYSVIVVIVIAVIVFIAINASGDPAAMLAPMDAMPEEVEALRVSMGLDRPLHERFLRFFGELFRGDLISFRYKRPPMELMLPHIWRSLQLSLPALILGALIAIPMGIVAAMKRGTLFDGAVMTLALVGQATPVFLFSVLLIWIFAIILGWLPVSGRGTVAHFVMPVASLTAFNIAILVRMTRATILETMQKEFIRTARAKGLSTQLVVLKHALPNALIPIVSLMGLQIGTLISGAVVIEWIFAWPGIGKLLFDSVVQRDMPLVMVGTLVIAVSVSLLNLAVDLTYGLLDPRITYS